MKLTVYLIQYLVVTTLDLHTLLTWYVPLYSRLCLEQHDLKLGFRRLQDGMFKISLDNHPEDYLCCGYFGVNQITNRNEALCPRLKKVLHETISPYLPRGIISGTIRLLHPLMFGDVEIIEISSNANIDKLYEEYGDEQDGCCTLWQKKQASQTL